MSSHAHNSELFRACRELFGPEVDLSTEFLDYLQPAGLKKAFRKRVWATHPDSAHRSGSDQEESESFMRLHDAYRLINAHLSRKSLQRRTTGQPEHPSTPSHHEPNSPERFNPMVLPQRQLLFGRYLCCLGIISFATLLKALAWQRLAKRRIGVIAREFGWLTTQDVSRILTFPGPEPFGDRAVRAGLLSDRQRKQLLLQQRIDHRRIGEYFLVHGMVTLAELDALLKGLHRHNARNRRLT